MKNTSFLAIFDTLFILSLLGFLLTKNSAIFFVSLPFYVGTSFSQYFKQKEKLDVFDDKLLRLLKLDTTIYAILFSIAFIISIKRKKLAQDLLIEKYRKK